MHTVDAACEPWERGPLARIPGEPRLAARHAGGPPALPGDDQRRALFLRVRGPANARFTGPMEQITSY